MHKIILSILTNKLDKFTDKIILSILTNKLGKPNIIGRVGSILEQQFHKIDQCKENPNIGALTIKIVKIEASRFILTIKISIYVKQSAKNSKPCLEFKMAIMTYICLDRLMKLGESEKK